MSLTPSPHAVVRMAQRGFNNTDLDLLLYLGSEVAAGFLVREKDVQRFERELKQLGDRARRLIGKRLVVDGACLVTAYHATGAKERRLLRDRRGLGVSD